MSTHKSILKSAGIVGFATLCSRILGFIRDIIIARLFGVYVYAQAFVIAFKIPNLFRDFIGEGAANSAFVPVFSEYTVKHTSEEFWKLVNIVLNLILVILMTLTILGITFAPLIVRAIAPGFIADAHKLAVTVKLTRIIFPYLILIGLSAYAMAVLNSLKHFSIPAFAPCLLNISIIVFAMIFGEGIKGLALGVLVGGFLQLLVQIPVLYNKGFKPELFKSFTHPAAKIIGKLMMPRLLSTSIYQLNNFVDSIFGSLAWIVGDGGVVGLYFAYRLILFPLGIFSTSLSQVLLPIFSAQALEDNYDKLKQSLSFGLRITFFLILPASVAFMVFSRQIIYSIFGGGKFDAYAVNITARVLFFYSFGLFAYASTRILQSCFFALKDTVTPTKISALALLMNIILNVLLMFPLKLSGIALATSISGIIAFFILFRILAKRINFSEKKIIYSSFLRIFLASIAMGIVCSQAAAIEMFKPVNSVMKLANLIFLLLMALTAYIIFCFIFRVSEIQEIRKWILKRK